MNQQLHDFIDSQLKSGITKDTIRQALLGAGWKVEDIEAEFASFDIKPALEFRPSKTQITPSDGEPIQKPIQEKPSILSPVQLVDKGSGRHPFVKILLGCLALFVIIGGGYLGWQYYQKYTTFEETKEAMKDMPQKMAGLSKYSYIFETKILINPEPNTKKSAQLEPKKFDLADLSNLVINYFNANKTSEDNIYLAQAQGTENWLIPKSLINNGIDLRISGSYENTGSHKNFSMLFDFTVEQQQKYLTGLSLELRRLGDTNYFRVVEIPAELAPLISSSLPGLSLTTILGKWFSVKDKTLSDLQVLRATATSGNENLTDINKRKQDLFDKSDLFEIKNAFLDTSVPGNSYVADVDIKPDNLKKFLAESIKINQDRIITKQEELYIDSTIKKLSEAKITVWTGAKDHYLQKAEIMASSTAQGNIVNFDAILGFSNFETAKIAEPTQAVAFDDELKKISYYIAHPLATNGTSSSPYDQNLAESSRLLSEKRYVESLKYAEQALAYAKTNLEKAQGYRELGLSYYYSKNLSKAEGAYKKALSYDNNYAPAYSSLAAVYIEYGKYEEALGYAKKSIGADPKYGWGYNNAGIAYENLGKMSDAIASYKTAMALDSLNPSFVYNLSKAYHSLNDIPSEITYLEKTLLIDDRYEAAYNNLGLIYIDQNKLNLAEQIYEKGTRKIPESMLIHDQLAFVYSKSGQYDKYEKELKLEIQYNSSYTKAYLGLFEYYAYYKRTEDLKNLMLSYLHNTGKTKDEIRAEINNTDWMKNKQKVLEVLNSIN